MSSWFLVCSSIGAFSVLMLEMFRPCAPALSVASRSHQCAASACGWQAMSEADLDALVEEFLLAAEEPAALCLNVYA